MDPGVTARRLAAFAAAGLDQERMRAWTVIRGAYLGADENEIEALRRSCRYGCSCSQRCSIVVVRAGWSGS